MPETELRQVAKVAHAQETTLADLDADIEEREAVARRIPMRYHNFD
ncbi:MAG: hypothetical protein OK456_08675 [Thaumarchaeota archaeon]|nr:hypothetical protein [Nitrososphaerota archaeon]